MLTMERLQFAKNAGEGPKLELFSEMCAYIESKWGFPDCECVTPAECSCGKQNAEMKK
jgi:hypothetical protein